MSEKEESPSAIRNVKDAGEEKVKEKSEDADNGERNKVINEGGKSNAADGDENGGKSNNGDDAEIEEKSKDAAEGDVDKLKVDENKDLDKFKDANGVEKSKDMNKDDDVEKLNYADDINDVGQSKGKLIRFA